MSILSFLNDLNDVCENFLRRLFNSATNFHVFVENIIINVMSTFYVIKNTKVSRGFLFKRVSSLLCITKLKSRVFETILMECICICTSYPESPVSIYNEPVFMFRSKSIWIRINKNL